MRTIRIHVDQSLSSGTELTLPSQASEHVARVLRLTAGDAITLFNGDGCDYPSLIGSVGKREVIVQVQAQQPLQNESPLQLTLAQAVARGEKMDLIVQKATELGIARITPLLTERSEVKLDASRTEKRVAHWQAVAASACEQSGRARLPDIATPQSLDVWLRGLVDDGTTRLALLPGGNIKANELSFPSASGMLVVGPEGGLGDRDVAVLNEAGFRGLVLGPRILRTETAGLAAIAALQAIHGDL